MGGCVSSVRRLGGARGSVGMLLALLVLALPARDGRAQVQPQRARGFVADGVYSAGEFDTINNLNGNLMIRIPIGQQYRIGDGLSYQFALHSNSDMWDQISTCAVVGTPQELTQWILDEIGWGPGDCERVGSVPSDDANAGMGWRFGFGTLRGRAGPDGATAATIYVDEEGGRHFFYGSHLAQSPASGTVAYTADGTYMRRRIIDATTQIVDMPDGSSKTFSCDSIPGTTFEPCTAWNSVWRLTEWKDTLGNALLLSYGNDPDGKEVWYVTERNPGGPVPLRFHYARFELTALRPLKRRLVSLDLAAAEGRRAVYEFHYDDVEIFRDLANTAYNDPTIERVSPTVTADGRVRVPQLREVVLRDGSQELLSWGFRYYDDQTTPASEIFPVVYSPGREPYKFSDLMGRIRRVVLPTKGEVEYTYGPYRFPRRTCDIGGPPLRGIGLSVTKGVLKKQLWKRGGLEKDGRPWLFMSNVNRNSLDPQNLCSQFPNSTATTVLDPLGAATVSYFSVYRNTSAAGEWRRSEYGLPVNHDETDAALAGLPAGDRSVSQKVFDCSQRLSEFDDPTTDLWRLFRKILMPDPGTSPLCGGPTRSTFVRYEYENADCDPTTDSECFLLNKRVKSERTVFWDDLVAANGAPVYSDTASDDFDTFGHYRIVTSDGNFGVANFNANTPSDRIATLTNFNDTSPANPAAEDVRALIERWKLDTYWEQKSWIQRDPVAPDASATAIRTLFSFDRDTGRLRARRVLNGLTPTPSDILTIYDRQPGEAGSILQTMTVFGGDGGNLSTTSVFGAPLSPAPASVFRTFARVRHGATEYSEHQTLAGAKVLQIEDDTIDASTGLVTRSRDTAGVETTFSYDLLGRMTRVTPRDDVPTAYSYVAAQPSSDARVSAAQGAEGPERHYLYDGQGRLWVTKERVPGVGLNKTVVDYLPMGQKVGISTAVPDSGGADPAVGVTAKTRYEYDYLGRPTRIVEPDGGKTTMQYGGIRSTQTKLWDVSGGSTWRFEGRDRHGRAVRVQEDSVRPPDAPPGPVENGAAVTRYSYDIMGHLVGVRQGAQTRAFVYDSRGFMTSRQEPELGVAGRGEVTYSQFDPMGHARRRPAGSGSRFDLTYDFDRAGRVTAISLLPGGTGNPPAVPLKEFSYYADNCGPTSFSAGKLQTATRHNYVTNPNPPPPGQLRGSLDIVVAETFSYEGREGRVSRRRTNVAYGDQALTFDLAVGYDAQGDLNEVTYPQCVEGCGAVTGPPRTVTSRFANGRLISVVNFADLVYHANGMLRRVTHGNGVVDEQTVDPSGMPRPRRLRTIGAVLGPSGVAGGDWDSGTYLYDGIGNIRAIGADRFVYDAVSRLVDAKVSGRRQKFAYDEFGNLFAMVRYDTVAEGAPAVSSMVVKASPLSNHLGPPAGAALPSFEYDASGNVVGWRDSQQAADEAAYQYSFDGFDMMKEIKGGAGLGKIYVYSADDERLAVIDYKAGGTVQPGLIKETWSVRGLGHEVLRDFESVHGTASGGWSHARDYVRQGLLLSASILPDDRRHYFHLDHLGTPRLVTDADKRRVSQPNYFPFGEELSMASDGERMKLTGHERDDNSRREGNQMGDLLYMHARYQNFAIGRFLSLDPASGGETARPQAWNRYAYVVNNPVGSLDPDGRERVNHVLGPELRYVPLKAQTNEELQGLATGTLSLQLGANVAINYILVRTGLGPAAKEAKIAYAATRRLGHSALKALKASWKKLIPAATAITTAAYAAARQAEPGDRVHAAATAARDAALASLATGGTAKGGFVTGLVVGGAKYFGPQGVADVLTVVPMDGGDAQRELDRRADVDGTTPTLYHRRVQLTVHSGK